MKITKEDLKDAEKEQLVYFYEQEIKEKSENSKSGCLFVSVAIFIIVIILI